MLLKNNRLTFTHNRQETLRLICLLSMLICCREGSTVLRRTLSTNLNQAAAVIANGGNHYPFNPCLHVPIVKVKQNGEKDQHKLPQQHQQQQKISPQSNVPQEEISLMSLKDLQNFDENVNQIINSPLKVKTTNGVWSGLIRMLPVFRSSEETRPIRL